MADYIYLLQHRLTPTQRLAMEAVRDAARGRGAPVFLVGGAVRDLTSGAPVRDLDFAVQGEVANLVEGLEAAGASLAGEDTVFGSRYFVFRGGVRVEIGPTITVSYPKPGEPEVQSAAILDDLRRRDFTVDAMAISLNEGSYGLLLDPLNGVADLENRELRLVSNLGFIEQPALLPRAARLSHRLGWNLEERTQRRYENAKDEGSIERLPEQARGYETEEIFHEEDPIATLEHLSSEGWLKELSPTLAALKVDRDALDRVRDTLGQMEPLGLFTDPSPVYFPLLTNKLPTEQTAALKRIFARPGFVRQIDTIEARSKELAAQLTSKASASPSATWKLLFAAEPEVVLALAAATRTGALQAKFKAFFTEWPQVRQRIPYALMQEMRIAPEIPGYDRLLDDLFFALMDGKLTTPEEMRAFLEPFSPPAPAQQTAPRRRAAKAARGRGRQAAAVVRLEEDDEPSPELDSAEDAGEVEADPDTVPEPRLRPGDLQERDSDESVPALHDEPDEGKESPETAEVPAGRAKGKGPEKKASSRSAERSGGAVVSDVAETMPKPDTSPVVSTKQPAGAKKAAANPPAKNVSVKGAASAAIEAPKPMVKAAITPAKVAVVKKAAAELPKASSKANAVVVVQPPLKKTPAKAAVTSVKVAAKAPVPAAGAKAIAKKVPAQVKQVLPVKATPPTKAASPAKKSARAKGTMR